MQLHALSALLAFVDEPASRDLMIASRSARDLEAEDMGVPPVRVTLCVFFAGLELRVLGALL